jgi:hypothetical protein
MRPLLRKGWLAHLLVAASYQFISANAIASHNSDAEMGNIKISSSILGDIAGMRKDDHVSRVFVTLRTTTVLRVDENSSPSLHNSNQDKAVIRRQVTPSSSSSPASGITSTPTLSSLTTSCSCFTSFSSNLCSSIRPEDCLCRIAASSELQNSLFQCFTSGSDMGCETVSYQQILTSLSSSCHYTTKPIISVSVPTAASCTCIPEAISGYCSGSPETCYCQFILYTSLQAAISSCYSNAGPGQCSSGDLSSFESTLTSTCSQLGLFATQILRPGLPPSTGGDDNTTDPFGLGTKSSSIIGATVGAIFALLLVIVFFIGFRQNKHRRARMTEQVQRQEQLRAARRAQALQMNQITTYRPRVSEDEGDHELPRYENHAASGDTRLEEAPPPSYEHLHPSVSSQGGTPRAESRQELQNPREVDEHHEESHGEVQDPNPESDLGDLSLRRPDSML